MNEASGRLIGIGMALRLRRQSIWVRRMGLRRLLIRLMVSALHTIQVNE